MSLPNQVIRQRDFSAGETDPDAERRDDRDEFKYGVRYARNLQSLRTGGLERRFGRTWLYVDSGVRDEFRPFPDVTYSVTFAHQAVRVRNADGSLVATLVAPWTDAMLDQLVWEAVENRIFVCGPFRTRVISVTPDTRQWSIAAFDFDAGLNGATLAPFYRFAAKGITLRPSGQTGNISVTASSALFAAGHVGTIFRYGGRQFRITGVSSATLASATVIEELPPTWEFTVGSSTGYTIGEIVETDVSNMIGEVVGIAPGKVTVVATQRFFSVTSGEKLIGPNAASTISGLSQVAPGATVQWDEIFMSDYRGWPRSVSKDAQRLIFCDFPQFKQAIVWSALSSPMNMEVGSEPDAAIFEYIQAECRVYHVIGGYDEFAITDSGVYYVPISADNPLVPGSVEFRIIFAGEVSSVRPVQVTEGVLFVDEARTGIFAIAATGQTARPYIASEITEFHRHLFGGIRGLAANSGTPQAASRQIFAVNDDGTMVIGQYNSDRNFVGWLKWESQGGVRAVSARYGAVVLSSWYPLSNGAINVAERMNPAELLDCAVAVSNGDFTDVLELSSGQPLTMAGGARLEFSSFRTVFLAGADVQICADGFYLGTITVGAGGEIVGFANYERVSVGYAFDWTMEPNLGAFEGGESFGQRLRRRKISKVLAKVRDTQEFRIGNRVFAGYDGGDDTSLPMPLRSGVYRYRQAGRSYDPNYTLSQTTPGGFKLLELTTEVTA